MKNNRRRWKDTYDLPQIVKARKKILEAFNNRLKFIEETHQYFLGDVEFDCVSNVTHMFQTFDREATLDKCAEKAQKYESYKYFGMTREEISEAWDRASGLACEAGTETHEFGESMFYYMIGEDDKILPSAKDKFKDGKPCPTTDKERQVVEFWNELPDTLIPVLAETKVFNQIGTPYAGTFDILFYYYDEKCPEKQGLVIFDYKTNEKLRSGFDTKMKEPFNNMVDESLSLYTLQLSLYQIPMEQLGLNVIARRIIWLQDNTYNIIKIPSVIGKLKKALHFERGKIEPKENKKVLV